MDVIVRTTKGGQVYEFVLEEPTDTSDGESSCTLVILVDGIETDRCVSYGIKYKQARELSSRLRDSYLDGFPE